MNGIKVKADELNLIKLAQEYADEDKARKLFESWRWPGGKPICPHCQYDEAYKIESKPQTKNQARLGLYGCAACRKTFTATVGTVLEDSHIPISKWLIAIFILCSSKKSVSANQLHRMLGVTYKTAWFMAHRLRFAMTPNHWAEPKLKGTVEVDETFVGGKGDGRTRFTRQSPVVALVERGGIAPGESGCLRDSKESRSGLAGMRGPIRRGEHRRAPRLQESIKGLERTPRCQPLPW